MAFGLTNAPGVDRAELEQIRQTAENAVPKTTTVNGRPLTGDISLTPADVGAGPRRTQPHDFCNSVHRPQRPERAVD